MSVRGSLSTMTVEDLLDWVDRRVMNGTLTVERSSIVRSFVFDGGYLVGVSSNQPGEHLGALLLRRGLLDQAALGRLLEVQAETARPLGALVTEAGQVPAEGVRAVLEEQGQEALLDTWAWPDGTFVFEPVAERPGADVRLALRLRACIVIGRQRALRWKQIRRFVPRDDLVLSIADEARLAAAPSTPADASDLHELVTAARRGALVEELVAQRHGRRFVVLDRLAQLVEQGAMAVVERVPARDLEPVSGEQAAFAAEDLGHAARQNMAQGATGAALDLARQALALEPGNPAMQTLHREIERAMFAELSRELLTSYRVPRLLVDRDSLDGLGLTDTERYLAGRIDGRWDLLSLMRVSPLREVEVLITFKRLADRGIISL